MWNYQIPVALFVLLLLPLIGIASVEMCGPKPAPDEPVTGWDRKVVCYEERNTIELARIDSKMTEKGWRAVALDTDEEGAWFGCYQTR